MKALVGNSITDSKVLGQSANTTGDPTYINNQ